MACGNQDAKSELHAVSNRPSMHREQGRETSSKTMCTFMAHLCSLQQFLSSQEQAARAARNDSTSFLCAEPASAATAQSEQSNLRVRLLSNFSSLGASDGHEQCCACLIISIGLS